MDVILIANHVRLKPKIEFTACFKQNKSPPPLPGTYNISGDVTFSYTIYRWSTKWHYKTLTTDPKSTQNQHRSNRVQATWTSHPQSTPTSAHHSVTGTRCLFSNQQTTHLVLNTTPSRCTNNSDQWKCTIFPSNIRKNKNRGFGLGERNAIYKSATSIPGPGAYFEKEINSSRLNYSSSESTFGRSQREVGTPGNALGPGEYSPQIYNNGSLLLSTTSGFKLKGKLP